MAFQWTPYTIPLFIVVVASALLAFFAWRRRPAPIATPFVLFMLAVAQWSMGYAMELGSTDLQTKLFWVNFEAVGAAILPVAWLAFALVYTGGGRWLTRHTLTLLAIVPLFALLLIWTNNFLFASEFKLDTSGPVTTVAATSGMGLWFIQMYIYLFLLLGTLLLIRAFISWPRLYRRQAGALLIGTLVPWLANGLDLFGLEPLGNVDLMPFAFTLTGLVFAWGLFRYRLLDIVPVARDAVVDGMHDLVIVLDVHNRIVDLNTAAQHTVGRTASEAIGKLVTQVLSEWPDLVEGYLDGMGLPSDIVLGEGKAQRHFDLDISPLYNRRGKLTGHLIVLRDITVQKQLEAQRKRSEEALRRAHTELEMRVRERTAELAQANKALKAEIAERKRAEEQIIVSLNEKELLLKEIHHRVKNNLQVISSLLNLQLRYAKSEQALEPLRESQNRVKTMALIHEKLYRSKDLASIDFDGYIQDLASYLFGSYSNSGGVRLKINVDRIRLGVDVAVPCGLAINELVSNSLKHAFPACEEGSEICIDLYRTTDGNLLLTVSDNGIGFPKNLDFKNTESLGLQLVNTLVDQLEGTIELDKSAGTAFKITFRNPNEPE
jgi:PAS domain S-box-containing protein